MERKERERQESMEHNKNYFKHRTIKYIFGSLTRISRATRIESGRRK